LTTKPNGSLAKIPLKAVVVGAGVMGYNHIRIYTQLPKVELAGVVEPHKARADAIAAQFQVPVFSDVTEMLRHVRPDLASVAVPTRLHFDIALQLLHSGIDVLLEKPIAANLEEARELVETAWQSEVIFGIGHIERFNPGVIALKKRLEENRLGKISRLKTRRLGLVPSRLPDTGVTLDLATHDLDLLLWLLGTLPCSLSSQLLYGIQTPYDDRIVANLKFPGGIEATLEADWLSPTKTRDLTVTGEKGCLQLNFITQELNFYPPNCSGKKQQYPAAAGAEEKKDTAFARPGPRQPGHPETGLVLPGSPEPLYRELETFVECCAARLPFPVSAEAGLRAVYLAELLVRAGESREIMDVALD
jgi:UDP-N-acetylglucosamine 3-dehydrogenase